MRTGKEVVEYHRSERSKLAQRIIELRGQIRSNASWVGSPNSLVRLALKRELRYVPFNPSPSNFRRRASELLAYSQTPIPNSDTEYYSCCGMDDYYGELRDSAREEAIEYFRAWKYLTQR